MSKAKKPKKIMSLQIEDSSQMEQSLLSACISHIPHIANLLSNPEGLDFIKHNIKVSKEGVRRIAHDSKNEEFHSLTKDDIELGEFVGRGAAGQVVKGIMKPNGKQIAIKSINIYDQEKRHQLMNDLSALLKHKGNSEDTMACPFLVKLYGAYFDEGSVKVVLELMDCGSLSDLIKKAKKAKDKEPIIQEPMLARIAMQILNGLMYLHVIGHQIHRDIKPANILINSKGEVKLTDFGIMKELDQTNQFVATQKGTVAYMSPETLKGEKINYLCDIWSFGLVMVELARGEYPYAVKRSLGIIEMLDIINKDPIPNLPESANYSDEFRDFIARCLERTPERRASAIELLSHPWILTNLYKKVDLEGWIKELWAEPKPVAVPQMETINEDDELQKE